MVDEVTPTNHGIDKKEYILTTMGKFYYYPRFHSPDYVKIFSFLPNHLLELPHFNYFSDSIKFYFYGKKQQFLGLIPIFNFYKFPFFSFSIIQQIFFLIFRVKKKKRKFKQVGWITNGKTFILFFADLMKNENWNAKIKEAIIKTMMMKVNRLKDTCKLLLSW